MAVEDTQSVASALCEPMTHLLASNDTSLAASLIHPQDYCMKNIIPSFTFLDSGLEKSLGLAKGSLSGEAENMQTALIKQLAMP